MYLLDVVVARLEVDLGSCQLSLSGNGSTLRAAHMFYGDGLAGGLLDALVDDAEAPACGPSVTWRMETRGRNGGGTGLTAKLLEDLVPGSNILVGHVAQLPAVGRLYSRSRLLEVWVERGHPDVNKVPTQWSRG